MDPYVIMELGKQKFKTKVHKNAGKKPSWSEVFEMQRTTEETLLLHVYDQDIGKDDHVGSGSLSINYLLSLPSYRYCGNVTLTYKNKTAGELYVDVTFYPNQPAAPTHHAPPPGHRAPAPAPAPGYRAPAPGYHAPAPGYHAPAPGHHAPAPGFQPGPHGAFPPQAYPQPGPARPGFPQQFPQPGYQQPRPRHY